MATTYQIQLTKRAAKELRKVGQGDPKLYGQIVDAIGTLGQDPYPDGWVDLGGREGFRIRVRQHPLFGFNPILSAASLFFRISDAARR